LKRWPVGHDDRETGPRPATAALYARWRPVVFDLLVRRLGNVEEAEALAHDALLRAFAAHERGEVEHFPAYLLRVATNLATDAQRRQRLERGREDPEEVLSTDAEPDRAELGRLRSAVDALPAECREIVDLRYGEGLSFGEIAAALGMSKNGVFARHERALDLLRAAFARRRT
jgi:RNA polymerase sigma-70 factor (ECF subfamily)